MNVESFVKNGGRIKHVKEGKRIITLAYRQSDGEILYGASMFRQEPGSIYNRKRLNSTAVERCTRFPVTIADSDMSTPDRVSYIRSALRVHGVANRS